MHISPDQLANSLLALIENSRRLNSTIKIPAFVAVEIVEALRARRGFDTDNFVNALIESTDPWAQVMLVAFSSMDDDAWDEIKETLQ